MGNLGADPVLRATPSGKAVLNFNIAVDEVYYTGEPGNKTRVTNTVWIPVVVWGRQATNCAQYLQKGSKVFLEGRLKPREYIDSEGVKHRTFEIVAGEIEFVDKIRGRATPNVDSETNTVTA